MFPVAVSLDRLVMIYRNVSIEEYDLFISRLQANSIFYPHTPIKTSMSSGIQAYRYNLNFGFGEGGVRIDYRHNTLPVDIKLCDLRIEFNPNKLSYLDTKKDDEKNIKASEPSKIFFKIFNETFNKKGEKKLLTNDWTGHVRCVREIDIAFDFNIPMDKIIVKSLSGKEHSIYKGTNYWGNKHTHGYTKMYDKKKERKKNKDKKYEKYEHLTRIEYTMRMEGYVGVNELSRIKDFEIMKGYQISIFDDEEFKKFDPTVKAYLLCYLNNLMQFKEMSRRYQEKTKKALENLSQINLDYILTKTFKENILSTINKYIRL